MPSDTFDTIVVGARCAGAPVAIQLARAGQRVLLLDAAKLPSDQPISTHVIQEVGLQRLDELGVGADVRRLAPPCNGIRIDLAGTVLDLPFGSGPSYAPRRLPLDRLLQEAAVRAGADLRDQTKVVRLLRDGDRVVGVEATHGDTKVEYRARLVVGADGRNSRVAELAGAKEYLGYDNPRFGYWAYWPRNAGWGPHMRNLGLCLSFDDKSNLRLVFQTGDDLLLIATTPLLSELPKWRGRAEEAYLETLRASPVTAPLIENNERASDLLGLLKARYAYREPVGPGYALVGDAGLHKDPTPGLGITDALYDARALSSAILDGRDEAFVRYWRQRDVDTIDPFLFAGDMADPSYVNPLNMAIYGAASRSPAIIERLQMQTRRELSPYETVPLGAVLKAMGGALLRGRFGVVPAFFAAAKRGAYVQRVRNERLALLEALPPARPRVTVTARAAAE